LNQHILAKSHQHKGISYFFHPIVYLNPMTFHIQFMVVDNSTKCKSKLDVELTSVPSGMLTHLQFNIEICF
jgi:hypothetical protein